MPLIVDRDIATDSSRLSIWQVEESVEELLARAALREVDMVRYNAISTDSRRKEWLAARVMAWENRQIHIDYSSTGQPLPDNRVGNLSISHTENYVALLSSDQPCGVDIESLKRDATRLVGRFATHSEVEMMMLMFPENPAIAIWSAKEALYKLVQHEGAEFKSELVLEEKIDRDKIKARACDSGAQVTFHHHIEDVAVAYARFDQCGKI